MVAKFKNLQFTILTELSEFRSRHTFKGERWLQKSTNPLKSHLSPKQWQSSSSKRILLVDGQFTSLSVDDVEDDFGGCLCAVGCDCLSSAHSVPEEVRGLDVATAATVDGVRMNGQATGWSPFQDLCVDESLPIRLAAASAFRQCWSLRSS